MATTPRVPTTALVRGRPSVTAIRASATDVTVPAPFQRHRHDRGAHPNGEHGPEHHQCALRVGHAHVGGERGAGRGDDRRQRPSGRGHREGGEAKHGDDRNGGHSARHARDADRERERQLRVPPVREDQEVRLTPGPRRRRPTARDWRRGRSGSRSSSDPSRARRQMRTIEGTPRCYGSRPCLASDRQGPRYRQAVARTPRVVAVIDSLGQGGAERSLVDTLRTIGPAWERHIVLQRRVSEGFEDEATAAGITLHDAPGSLPSRVLRLRRLVRDLQPDVVHASLWNSDLASRLALVGPAGAVGVEPRERDLRDDRASTVCPFARRALVAVLRRVDRVTQSARRSVPRRDRVGGPPLRTGPRPGSKADHGRLAGPGWLPPAPAVTVTARRGAGGPSLRRDDPPLCRSARGAEGASLPDRGAPRDPGGPSRRDDGPGRSRRIGRPVLASDSSLSGRSRTTSASRDTSPMSFRTCRAPTSSSSRPRTRASPGR